MTHRLIHNCDKAPAFLLLQDVEIYQKYGKGWVLVILINYGEPEISLKIYKCSWCGMDLK